MHAKYECETTDFMLSTDDPIENLRERMRSNPSFQSHLDVWKGDALTEEQELQENHLLAIKGVIPQPFLQDSTPD
jgi:hypothetical protein